MLKTLQKLETELHQPNVRKDSDRMNQLLHDSFLEIGRSGQLYDKAKILATLSCEPTHRIWSQNYQAQELGPGLILLTYKSAHLDDENKLSRFTLRTSIWEHTDQGWTMRFHQGTPTQAFIQTTH